VRIFLKRKTSDKVKSRLKSKARIRKKVKGTAERPRLAVYRSGKHIYAQVIDDVRGVTIVSASTLKLSKGASVDGAKEVGASVAKKAIEKGIKDVVFDRGGYVYHGKVKAMAGAARESGLNF
jgi:large subunit ribosomal protein L18